MNDTAKRQRLCDDLAQALDDSFDLGRQWSLRTVAEVIDRNLPTNDAEAVYWREEARRLTEERDGLRKWLKLCVCFFRPMRDGLRDLVPYLTPHCAEEAALLADFFDSLENQE